MPLDSKLQIREPADPHLAAGNEERAVVDEKNPHAVALGRLGGLKGGTARAKALSADRRREIASLAAKARWHSDVLEANISTKADQSL